MGYTTYFDGELRVTTPLSPKEYEKMASMFGEDCRDHPEWGAKHLYYIDLKSEVDDDGNVYLKHNGAEKTYDLHELINVVITEMRKHCPFELSGVLHATGEDGERWYIAIGNDGFAYQGDYANAPETLTCPTCGRSGRE